MKTLLAWLLFLAPAHGQDPCVPPPEGLEDLASVVSLVYEETREAPEDPAGFCPEDLSAPMDLDDADARAARLSQGDRDAAAELIAWSAEHTGDDHVQALANAAALLDALLKATLDERGDPSAIIDALLAMAADAVDPMIHRQIALNLWRRQVDDPRVDALVEQYLPKAPDYHRIFPEGETTIEATLHTGHDGFEHSDFEAVFSRAGANVSSLGGDDLLVEYEVVPDDPTLPTITWKITVRDAGWPPSGIFDEFSDDSVNVAMYGNHSQLGTAMDRPLSRTSPEAAATDFYWNDSCKSKVFASQLSQWFPRAHIVYTKSSEYFHDMPRSFQRGLVAMTNRYDYDQMRRYVASGDAFQGRNYIFPDDENKLVYQDQDGDGVSDFDDRLYDVNVGYEGELASRAVHIANTYLGYSAGFGKGTEDTFRPDGVFDGEPGGPYTVVEERKDPRGARRYYVQVSEELVEADQSFRTATIARDLARHYGERNRWPEDRIEAGSFLAGAAVYDVWGGSGWDDYVRESVPGVSFDRGEMSDYLDDDDFVTRSGMDRLRKELEARRR